MTLSQDLTSRALFHSKNNVILVTLPEREILIATWPLLRGAYDASALPLVTHISRSEACPRLQQPWNGIREK